MEKGKFVLSAWDETVTSPALRQQLPWFSGLQAQAELYYQLLGAQLTERRSWDILASMIA